MECSLEESYPRSKSLFQEIQSGHHTLFLGDSLYKLPEWKDDHEFLTLRKHMINYKKKSGTSILDIIKSGQ